jgi:hypothetical protein
MKVIIEKIEEWDFDLRKAMKEMKYKSYRDLSKKVGLHWTYLSKIAKGLPVKEEVARDIINKIIEPKDCRF